MTVAISCNLSDGVILGVDSAVSVPAPGGGGIAKVYENAEKLFQLGDRPIGIAIYGLGALGARSIGSYIREFELHNHNGVVLGPSQLSDVVEELRLFMMTEYSKIIIPAVEASSGKKFAELPPEQWPAIGLIVGGFSSSAFLSEVWHILLPQHNVAGSATRARDQGSFGTNWYAMFEPIRRYIKGIDYGLSARIQAFCEKLKGGPLAPAEAQELQTLFNGHEYQVPFAAMPMQEGVEHVRFLVELVINHHRFSSGPPVVGGKVGIGRVTYKGERFQLLDA